MKNNNKKQNLLVMAVCLLIFLGASPSFGWDAPGFSFSSGNTQPPLNTRLSPKQEMGDTLRVESLFQSKTTILDKVGIGIEASAPAYSVEVAGNAKISSPVGANVANSLMFGFGDTDTYSGFSGNPYKVDTAPDVADDTCDGDITLSYTCKSTDSFGSCVDIAEGKYGNQDAWYIQYVKCVDTTSSPTNVLHKIINSNGSIKFLDNQNEPNFLIGQDGNAAIGTETIAEFNDGDKKAKLTVDGLVAVDGVVFPNGSVQTSATSGLPDGTVMFFDQVGCPSGWTELEYAKGRYVVGLDPANADSSGVMVGQALSNQESRPAGAHTHEVGNPTHTHKYSYWSSTSKDPDDDGSDNVAEAPSSGHNTILSFSNLTVEEPQALPSDTSTREYGAAGTPAPYKQYTLCTKGEAFWEGLEDTYGAGQDLGDGTTSIWLSDLEAQDTCDGFVTDAPSSVLTGQGLGKYTCQDGEKKDCVDVYDLEGTKVLSLIFSYKAKKRNVTCVAVDDSNDVYPNQWGWTLVKSDVATPATPPSSYADTCDGNITGTYHCSLSDNKTCVDVSRRSGGWYKATVTCNPPRLLPLLLFDDYGVWVDVPLQASGDSCPGNNEINPYGCLAGEYIFKPCKDFREFDDGGPKKQVRDVTCSALDD